MAQTARLEMVQGKDKTYKDEVGDMDSKIGNGAEDIQDIQRWGW